MLIHACESSPLINSTTLTTSTSANNSASAPSAIMIAPKHSVHLLTKRLYILGLHSALLLFQVINHGDHASLREKPFSTLQPYPTTTHTHQHGFCCSRATAFLPSHVLPRFASLLSRQLGFAPEAGKSDRHGVPLPPPPGGDGQGRTGPRSRPPIWGTRRPA